MNEAGREGGSIVAVTWLSGLINGFIDLIYPPTCAMCGGSSSSEICSKCWGNLIPISERVCSKCGNPIISGEPCPFCLAMEFHFDKAISFYAYAEPLRDALLSFKYHAAERKGKALAGLFAEGYEDSPVARMKFDIIVPVPLTSKKMHHRSYNQSEILAFGISDVSGIPVVPYALLKVKDNPSQTGFDLGERIENVFDSFKVADPLLVKGKKILLVDDIITTGATVSECARALKAAGAGRVIAISLARGIMKDM